MSGRGSSISRKSDATVERFWSEAFKPKPGRPPGGVTLQEVATKHGLTYGEARRRMADMLREGKVKRVEGVETRQGCGRRCSVFYVPV